MKFLAAAIVVAIASTASTAALAGPAQVYMPDPTKKKISNGTLVSSIIPAREQAAIAKIRSRGGGAQYIPQTILNPSADDRRFTGDSCETDIDIGNNAGDRSGLTNGNDGVYVERLEVIETRPCLGAARRR